MMNYVTRKFLYKLISLAAIYCSLMPLVAVLKSALRGVTTDFLEFVIPFVMLMGGFYFAHMVWDRITFVSSLLSRILTKPLTFFLDRKPTGRDFSIAAIYISAIFPAALGLCINAGESWQLAITDVAVLVLFYVLGVRCSIKSLKEIYTSGRICTEGTVLAAALLVTYISENALFLRQYILLSSYLYILSILLIKNELMIESGVIGRKDSGKRVIPSNIRRYNNIAILFVFGFILLLFNLKHVVVAVAFVLKLIIQVIALIVLVFFWLMSWQPKDGGKGITPESQADIRELAKGKSNSPYESIIIGAIVLIIILFCCYKFLPAKFRSLKKILYRLRTFLRCLFKSNSGNSDKATNEYYDEVEIIEAEKNRSKSRQNKAHRGNPDKVKDPILKIRLIYKCIIGYFIKQGIDIKNADTTREIQVKTSEITDTVSQTENITGIYEKIRYGDCMPDNSETESATEMYELIIRRKRIRKPG